MWIRTQDKTVLIKCNNFSVECYTDSKTNIKSFDIETIESHNGTYTTLGSYSTKEKALKVLDRLQEHIAYVNSHQNDCYGGLPHIDYYVFQMPQDSEVE